MVGFEVTPEVDAHPEIFSVTQSRGRGEDERSQTGALSRCDLVQIRLRANRLDVSFVEVKSRAGLGGLTELTDRMCDQMEATEKRFRDLFFSPDVRVDHIVQRSKLTAVLRFYAKRALRYGFFESSETLQETLRLLTRLEGGIPQMKSAYRGFVVDLAGAPRKPYSRRGASFRILTAKDFESATVFRTSEPTEPTQGERPATEPVASPPRPPATVSPSSELPASLPIELAVPLGVSLDEEIVTWKAGVKGSPHLFIIGIPGQGKSWTTTRLLCETARQGLPSIIIDFHGQFGSPNSEYYRLAKPAVWDATQGLPFSPFEAVSQQDGGTSYWKTNAFAIAEIFQYVFGLGDIQRGIIYDSMRDCYLEAGFESSGQPALPKLAELERKIRQHEERRGTRNVLVRCQPVFDFQLFREGVDAGNIDFLKASERGLVIDLHRHSLEQLQMAAGAFVLRKIYKDMFAWGEKDRLRVAIVLDEAHRISRDTTLPKIMKEGRKFGVVVISASQGVNDFHPDVLGNAGTKIVFRTNFPASRKVAGFLKPRREENFVDTIEQLPVGSALVQTPDMHYAVRTQMYPPCS
ncbi:MAG: ATP-binding protein [Acidobacteria bacterium]|nr:ATP-binding protein [Acidobacteriota bacterium]